MIDRLTPCSKVRIVVLDACRDDLQTQAALNGKAITKSIAQADGSSNTTKQVMPSLGLAAMDAADNTFLAYAAAPGKVAYASNTDLSPFTSATIKHLDTVDLPI